MLKATSFVIKFDGVTVSALDAAIAPATAAQCYILVITTNFHLIAIGYYIACAIDTRVDDGFAATGAGGFDFLDGVGQLKQTARTFKHV